MSWIKLIKKVTLGSLNGGTATLIATQGDVQQTAISAGIIGLLTGLINFFKNKGK